MKNNKNEENLALLINVSDSLSVQAKMTFESCTIDGIQATYWGEDDDQIEDKVNSIFDILFDEMTKNRRKINNMII